MRPLILVLLIAIAVLLGLRIYSSSPLPPLVVRQTPLVTQDDVNKAYEAGVARGIRMIVGKCLSEYGFSFGKEWKFTCSRLKSLNLDTHTI